MTLSLGFKGGVVGYGVEGTYGTAVTRTIFNELVSEGIVKDIEAIHSEAIPAIFTDEDEFSQGNVAVSGDIEVEMRYQGMETLVKHAMGAVSTAEVASFVVTASNKKLDFNIGAAQLTATVAEGTYIAGTDQTTALSLCKAIYDAIVAAEALGTYTVSYSTSTNKFTITRSAGTFVILWNTGTNTLTNIATLIGYSKTADDTGGLTYTSDTALTAVYTHTFTLADDLPTGLTMEIDRDQTAFIAEGVKINTFSISSEVGGLVKASFGIIGEDINTGAVTSATLPTAPYMVFTQGVISYNAGAINVKSVSLDLNNNLATDRRFIGSALIKEPQRTAKIEATGSFSMEFEGTTQYTDFVAGTSKSLSVVFTGAVIKTAIAYGMTITMSKIKLQGAPINITDPGVIMMELPFKAYATDSSTREFTITITNTLATVA